MDTRLVVGCGSVGGTLVDALAGIPGQVLVLEERERRVERLREAGVAADLVDSLDAATIGRQADGVETVVVADDETDRNLALARAVREALEDVFLLVYPGVDPTAEDLETFGTVADSVVDPTAATAAFLMDRVGDAGRELRRLRDVVTDVAEPLAIFTHDNPDPDAIASALALQRIAASLGVTAEVCYFGQISHQENRAFVNLLDLELTRLDADADLERFGGFALVDHSRPGVNDQLPPETPVDVVIDHHPPRGPVDARFVDLRSNVGATSTLLVQYLQGFGIDIDETVATALLFGIRVDTNDFDREVSMADFDAAAAIVTTADVATLERIESPSISGDTLDTIASAISNRQRRGSVVTSCVDQLNDRDALAQAADRLLDMADVNASVVYGSMDGVIYVSGRARGTELDLGETLRDAFDQIGSAGGHADMAGAQIQVEETTLAADASTQADGQEAGDAAGTERTDVPATGDGAEATSGSDAGGDGEGTGGIAAGSPQPASLAWSDEDPPMDLETFVAERFFEALESRPRRETTGLYVSEDELGDAGW